MPLELRISRRFFMPKTRLQKEGAVAQGVRDVQVSQSLVLVDFTGVPVDEFNVLRRAVRAAGGAVRVMKKRLLQIVFGEAGFDFDRDQVAGQVAVMFSPKELVEAAHVAYQFVKRKGIAKILGGFDVHEKRFIAADEVVRYGALPGRTELLTELAVMLTIPMKKLLIVLSKAEGQKGRRE